MSELRPFLLVSDAIDYTDGVATFQFPRTPQGSARCAITGIRAWGSGANVAAANLFATLITQLVVGGRNYVQGAVPLALIAGGPLQPEFDQPPLVNRFPGRALPLPCGRLASGIRFGAADEVRVRLELLDTEADSHVKQLVLECVQFPDDARDPLNRIYDAMLAQGHGETFITGQEVAGWRDPGTVITLEQQPQPPIARALRRWGYRALLMNTATGAPAAELGAIGAVAMNNLALQVWGSFQRAPQNQFAPIRAIAGTPNSEPATGLVDMLEQERNMAQVNFAGAAAADPDYTLYLCTLYEGRDLRAPALTVANAIS